MSEQGSATDTEKPKDSEKTCPRATLSTNPTWSDLREKPGLHGEKSAELWHGQESSSLHWSNIAWELHMFGENKTSLYFQSGMDPPGG